MRKADAVIVGGGVVGCSIAFHLAKMGMEKVLLLEKNLLASGSTGKCAGGIRQQFSTAINIQICMASVKFLERFQEETGSQAKFHQNGYLLLASTEEEAQLFEENVQLQKSFGLNVKKISPEEAKEIVPQLNVEDIVAACFCPTDGYADPHEITMGFANKARELGVKISIKEEAKKIVVDGRRVEGIITTEGEVRADWVVDAAGPHASIIARMVGVELPVSPQRRQILVTQPSKLYSGKIPMVIDVHNHLYFRPETGDLVLMGGHEGREEKPCDPDNYDEGVDFDFMARISEKAIHRVPMFEELRVMRGWAGLYEVTPDRSAILGETSVEGFLLATGFSGHGFMQAPAVGKLIAELIIKGGTSIDISPLNLRRFEEGKLLHEKLVF